jgi:hypothetical protein
LDKLGSALNLTEDQKTKIRPIVEQAAPQLKAIHDEAMAKAKAVVESAAGQVKPILTPPQQQQLDQLRQHFAPPPEAGKPGAQAFNPAGRLTTELGLNPEQEAKVKAVFEESRPQMKAILEDTTLSRENKTAKLRALHDTIAEKIKPLLTPEQQQKADQLKERFRERHEHEKQQ